MSTQTLTRRAVSGHALGRPGARSTWRSCQSVNASRPHSWRERSSRRATWSSSRRVDHGGSKKPCRCSVSGESVSRANGSSSPRSHAAAGIEKPRLRRYTIERGSSGSAALRSSTFFRSAAHLVPRRQRVRERRDDGVAEGHARLERVRHRGAVGLHEQVVDEVDGAVDVLEPREQLGAVRLGERTPVEVERVEAVGPSRQLGAQLGREDLLPAVVSLERREVRRADEALRAVVEARLRARARETLDERRGDARQPADPEREQVGRVRVVAAEELVAALARERDLHVSRRELGDEVRRERRRVGERLVERLGERGEQQRGVGTQHELVVVGRVRARDLARVRRARRTSSPRSRSRTSAAARRSPRPRAPRARPSRRRPRAARRPERR